MQITHKLHTNNAQIAHKLIGQKIVQNCAQITQNLCNLRTDYAQMTHKSNTNHAQLEITQQ